MTGFPLGIAVASLLALALDRTVREPPAAYHPVSLFGRVVGHFDRRDYGAARAAGTMVAVGLPVAAAGLVYGVAALALGISPLFAAVLAGVVLWSTSSLWLLLDAADRAITASDGDLDAARETLPALVGRETTDLSPELVRSAAVESLAENLSDGLVAPLFAFAVFAVVSLPAAAAAATLVKAVNTLDSMLGYPGAFGWASARLDDAVMFVPARLTAGLLGLASGDPTAPFRARRYAAIPASPNAGWPMGTLAAAANVRLEKPGEYVLNEVADYPSVADGRAAIRTARTVGVASYGAVTLLGVTLWL